MTSNWVKECGVDVGGCEWCLMTEIANDRLEREVAEGEDLAVKLAQDRARYRDQARYWKFSAVVAVVVVVAQWAVVMVAGWIK